MLGFSWSHIFPMVRAGKADSFRTTSQLISWYFEPSQAQRITSGLKQTKTNFNLSPIYSAHKSSNYKFPKNHKTSPNTNVHETKHTQTKIQRHQTSPAYLLGLRQRCLFVSRCFEPSQPQRITPRLKTMFNLSPIHSARKSSNHKFSKNNQICPDTN